MHNSNSLILDTFYLLDILSRRSISHNIGISVRLVDKCILIYVLLLATARAEQIKSQQKNITSTSAIRLGSCTGLAEQRPAQQKALDMLNNELQIHK